MCNRALIISYLFIIEEPELCTKKDKFLGAMFIAALRCSNKECTAVKFFEPNCKRTTARKNPFGNGRRRRVAGSELVFFELHSGQRIA